jgi:hypothetical protein
MAKSGQRSSHKRQPVHWSMSIISALKSFIFKTLRGQTSTQISQLLHQALFIEIRAFVSITSDSPFSTIVLSISSKSSIFPSLII